MALVGPPKISFDSTSFSFRIFTGVMRCSSLFSTCQIAERSLLCSMAELLI